MTKKCLDNNGIIFKKESGILFCDLNQVLVVHGPISSGKTNRAQQITDRAKTMGYKVYGIISKRVLREIETIGYEAYFPATGETKPIVYRASEVSGEEWEPLRGPYLYNKHVFEKANDNLIKAAHLMDQRTFVVADEFGHLEARGFGLYPGLVKVVESLQGGGKLLIPCRTDKVDNVLRLFKEETKVLVIEASRNDFWDSLGDSFI